MEARLDASRGRLGDDFGATGGPPLPLRMTSLKEIAGTAETSVSMPGPSLSALARLPDEPRRAWENRRSMNSPRDLAARSWFG